MGVESGVGATVFGADVTLHHPTLPPLPNFVLVDGELFQIINGGFIKRLVGRGVNVQVTTSGGS